MNNLLVELSLQTPAGQQDPGVRAVPVKASPALRMGEGEGGCLPGVLGTLHCQGQRRFTLGRAVFIRRDTQVVVQKRTGTLMG